MTSQYTVIGIYESTGQVFSDYVEASDAYEAMRLVAYATEVPEDLQILGAVQGGRLMHAACEDSGKAAFAIDLRETEAIYKCGACGCTTNEEFDRCWQCGVPDQCYKIEEAA
jgi:hypothetical protein